MKTNFFEKLITNVENNKSIDSLNALKISDNLHAIKGGGNGDGTDLKAKPCNIKITICNRV